MIDCFARCPTPMGQLLLEHFHGAVTRVGPTDTAFPHRSPGYNLLGAGAVDGRRQNDCLHRLGARFLCQPCSRSWAPADTSTTSDDDEARRRRRAAYGPNYRRLQQIKAKYDPENFFRMNQNIQPLSSKP